ncbi:MAG: recombination mediator RecR [Patescibacteria group bacterium]
MDLPSSIKNLIGAFSQLPTVGRKTAERFVFYLLQQDQLTLDKFSAAVKNAKQGITKCEVCGCVSETNPCPICANSRRDFSTICVVSTTRDLMMIENTGAYNGRYHVLGGVIDAIKAVAPEQLNINGLTKRLPDKAREVILALSPTFEGETTALYLTKLLKNYDLKITRLARGLPSGADLQYADEITLKNALENRK